MSAWIAALFASTLASLPAAGLALLLGRVSRLSPKVKVRISRVALLKAVAGLLPITLLTLELPKPALADGGSTGLWTAYVTFLFVIWVSGVVTVLADLAFGWRATAAFLQASDSVPADRCERIRAIWRSLGQRGPINVRENDALKCPCAISLGGPSIVLPKGFEDEANRSAIAHELIHLANRDLVWTLAYRFAYALLWFNPTVSRLESEAVLWQEAAADLEACRVTGASSKAHGEAILRCAGGSIPAMSVGLSGDGKSVARRLRALNGEGRPRWAWVAATLLMASAIVPVAFHSGGHVGKQEPMRRDISAPVSLSKIVTAASGSAIAGMD